MHGSVRLIFVGHSNSLIPFLKNFDSEQISVLYQYKPDDSLTAFCIENEISLKAFSFTEVNNNAVKIVIEYNKLVPSEYLKFGNWFNIHAGILPKWRGISANLWAILRNESEIGLSFHIMTDKFDDGELLLVEKIGSKELTFYVELKKLLVYRLSSKLPILIEDYLTGNSKLISNSIDPAEINFCKKMSVDLSFIQNFSIEHETILNTYKIFGHSSNSGVFFGYGDFRCKIISLCDANYSEAGKIGEILDIAKNSYLIKTNGGALWIEPQNPQVFLSTLVYMQKSS
jgi:methionyl-tRNA formyltransferase